MIEAGTPASDPKAQIRSRQYRALLVLAAAVGLLVSTAAWLFLEAVHEIEIWVYQDLPHHLGYSTAPEWWPLPWLVLAGLLRRSPSCGCRDTAATCRRRE